MANNKKYLDSLGLKKILESLRDYIKSQNELLENHVNSQDEALREQIDSQNEALNAELIALNNRLIDEINAEVAAREELGEDLKSHVDNEYQPLKEKVDSLDQSAIKNLGANQEILGDLKIKKSKEDSTLTGNLYVEGDLVVNGETTTVTHESIAIKDHTFIINSDGDDLSTLDDSLSGLVIRKDTESAYGIMYDPIGDGVKIGLGSIDESSKVKDFNYATGEAQFLATRADEIISGNIPEWDGNKKQFIDSKVSVDSLLTDQNVAEIARSGDIKDLMDDGITNIIFDGGGADVILAILDITELA